MGREWDGREGKEEDNRREYDVSNGTRLFEIQQSGKARLNPRVCQRGAVIEINNSLGGKLKTEIRSSFDRAPPRDEKVINVAQIEPGHFRIYVLPSIHVLLLTSSSSFSLLPLSPSNRRPNFLFQNPSVMLMLFRRRVFSPIYLVRLEEESRLKESRDRIRSPGTETEGKRGLNEHNCVVRRTDRAVRHFSVTRRSKESTRN